MYDILAKKRIIKDIEKLPAAIQKKLAMLIDDLKTRGPISLNTAKKLAKLFNIPIGRLLT
jgi:mRNA-degrading endonuclease RelE of RelBE toxin-antitoxin system